MRIQVCQFAYSCTVKCAPRLLQYADDYLYAFCTSCPRRQIWVKISFKFRLKNLNYFVGYLTMLSLTEITKNPTQDSLCPGLESNRMPLECERRALPLLQPARRVNYVFKSNFNAWGMWSGDYTRYLIRQILSIRCTSCNSEKCGFWAYLFIEKQGRREWDMCACFEVRVK
jgi:hypothetical protein